MSQFNWLGPKLLEAVLYDTEAALEMIESVLNAAAHSDPRVCAYLTHQANLQEMDAFPVGERDALVGLTPELPIQVAEAALLEQELSISQVLVSDVLSCGEDDLRSTPLSSLNS